MDVPLFTLLFRIQEPALLLLVYLLPSAWVGALAPWEDHAARQPQARWWLPAARVFAVFVLVPTLAGGFFLLLTYGMMQLGRTNGAGMENGEVAGYLGLILVPPIWTTEVLIAIGWSAIVAAKRLTT